MLFRPNIQDRRRSRLVTAIGRPGGSFARQPVPGRRRNQEGLCSVSRPLERLAFTCSPSGRRVIRPGPTSWPRRRSELAARGIVGIRGRSRVHTNPTTSIGSRAFGTTPDAFASRRSVLARLRGMACSLREHSRDMRHARGFSPGLPHRPRHRRLRRASWRRSRRRARGDRRHQTAHVLFPAWIRTARDPVAAVLNDLLRDVGFSGVMCRTTCEKSLADRHSMEEWSSGGRRGGGVPRFRERSNAARAFAAVVHARGGLELLRPSTRGGAASPP